MEVKEKWKLLGLIGEFGNIDSGRYVVVFGDYDVFGFNVCCGVVTRRNDVAAYESLDVTVFVEFEKG